MSMFNADDCERCGARVRQRGDHTCPKCAGELGRDVGDPWWGHFAGHPDADTRPERADLEPKELPNGWFQVAA